MSPRLRVKPNARPSGVALEITSVRVLDVMMSLFMNPLARPTVTGSGNTKLNEKVISLFHPKAFPGNNPG